MNLSVAIAKVLHQHTVYIGCRGVPSGLQSQIVHHGICAYPLGQDAYSLHHAVDS